MTLTIPMSDLFHDSETKDFVKPRIVTMTNVNYIVIH